MGEGGRVLESDGGLMDTVGAEGIVDWVGGGVGSMSSSSEDSMTRDFDCAFFSGEPPSP